MREYLFRGKQKDFEKWVTGSLTIEYDGTCHITVWVNELIEPENDFWEMVSETHEVLPETVGQSLNHCDKTEKIIFEGDIVKCYDYSAIDNAWSLDKIHIGVIEYTSPCYSLKIPGKLIYDTPCVKSWGKPVYLDYWCNAENLEVIGNIHDNPELLQSL